MMNRCWIRSAWRALADLIQRAGIDKRYFLYGRSDTIARHPELLEQWKKVGLERVFVGLGVHARRRSEIDSQRLHRGK